MTTFTVGAGQQYATLAAAVAVANIGDTIDLKAGTYTNDFPALINGLTIEGVGGIAKLVATAQPGNGKTYLDTAGNTTLRNLDISGVTVPDANGAAIRYESGNLVIQNSALHGNQNGLLGAPDLNGSITIDHSEVYANGTGSGSTHDLYIGDIAQFTLTNSYVHDANTGHEVKSRAESNTILNNRIEDNSSTAAYEIDLPNGGNATVSGNTIQKSANSGNRAAFAYGEEGSTHAGTSVSLTNNTFVSDQSPAYVVWDTTGAAMSASGNTIYGYSQIDKSGYVSSNGFTALGSRPALDTSSPIDQSGGTTVAPAPAPSPPKPASAGTPSSAPTPGPDTVVVNASASLAGGVGAHFNLVVDGATVGNATVNSTTTQAYSFNTTLAGGSSAAHDVQVLFDNDAVINGQDRNLYLRSISIDGQTTAASDSHEVYHATGTASTGFGPGNLASNGNMYWQGAAEFNLLPAVAVSNQTPVPSSAPAHGPDTIVVNASASLAGGVGAHFNLVVDGATIGNATVNSTTTQAYSFNTTLAGGSSAAHDVQVLFDNDAVINGQDRNLYLRSISIDGQTTAATDSHEVYHATGTASTGFGPGNLASNGNMYWQGAAEFSFPAMLR